MLSDRNYALIRLSGVSQEVLDRRVAELGLTDEDVEWNQRLGRPLHWKETIDLEAEAQRRKEWTAANEEREQLMKQLGG